MKVFQRLLHLWQDTRAEFNNCLTMQRLASGDLRVEHYKAILREISHHARENPQLQALATVRFRGDQRKSVRRFLQHAISEVGHDQLALNDLAYLGEDISAIPFRRPLPNTLALIGFGFYQVQHLDPVGYLGYLFHLEFAPTQDGAVYMQRLRSMGVPDAAMTFLHDHSTIDIGHNKLMEFYAEELITTQSELDAVVYAMRATSCLYAGMLDGAVRDAESPADWGSAPEERRVRDSSVSLAVRLEALTSDPAN